MMKPTRPLVVFAILAMLLMLSGCVAKDVFTFPAKYPATTEHALINPYTNLPNRLTFGNTRQCLMYDMPEAAPSKADVLAHYQAEMKKQGWEGDPSELTETENKLTATWLDQEHHAGVMLIYSPDMWLAIVCIGNP